MHTKEADEPYATTRAILDGITEEILAKGYYHEEHKPTTWKTTAGTYTYYWTTDTQITLFLTPPNKTPTLWTININDPNSIDTLINIITTHPHTLK